MGTHMITESAIVSCGPVPMHPKLIRCCWGKSRGGHGKSMTFSGSTSGTWLDCECKGHQPLSVVPGDGTEVWGKYI
jgi:hypothetical protein